MRQIIQLLFLFILGCTTTTKNNNNQAYNYYSWGTQALMSKDYGKAISHLRQAVEIDPHFSDAHNNLGMAYYFKKQIDLAYNHLEKSLSLNPKNTDALSNLASLDYERGDITMAEQKYQQCLKDLTYEKNARVYYNLSLIELKRNNLSKARHYLTESVSENADYCPSWIKLGLIDFESKNYPSAYNNFLKAGMGTCAQDPLPVYWQGLILIEMKKFVKARLKFEELNSRFTDHPYRQQIEEKLTTLSILEKNHMIESKLINETESPTF